MNTGTLQQASVANNQGRKYLHHSKHTTISSHSSSGNDIYTSYTMQLHLRVVAISGNQELHVEIMYGKS